MWNFILEQINQNQFLSGGAVLALFGIIIAYLRKTPYHIYKFITRRLIIRIDILDRDEAFDWIVKWLAKHPYHKRCRLLSVKTSNKNEQTVAPQSNFNKDKKNIILAPAPGPHVFFYKKRLIILWRHRQEGGDLKGGLLGIQEHFNITIFSRNIKLVKDLLMEAREVANPSNKNSIKIYRSVYDDWALIRSQDKRPLDSVILNDNKEKFLADDIKEFFNSKNWYKQCGIPYRRGYLLYGKPGNGKSSIVTALASELNLNICVLNLNNSYLNDDRLVQLFTEVPTNSIILLEDIDCVFEERKKPKHETESTVTFSGLLNALDGIISPEGQIVFMTTNFKERLDEALIRPGRCDINLEFENATPQQGEKLFLKFFPNNKLAKKFSLHCNGKYSMATLQGFLVKNKNNPEKVFCEFTQ